MATSGSYDNTSTMSNIIYDAHGLIGVHDVAETLPAEKWVYAKRVLNQAMAMLSMRRGLWLIDDVTVTLTPGTTNYTIGVGETVDSPKPMSIEHARRVDSSSNHIPLRVVSRNDYMSIPNKTLQAPATMVYYDPRRDDGELYVWPTGTTTEATIIIESHRPIQDFDAEGNNPDLPKEWVLAITYLLATLIAPQYLGGVVPASIQAQSDRLLATLSLFDEEKTSIFIQPV